MDEPSEASAGAGAPQVEEADERTLMASSIASLAGPGVVVQFTIEPDGFIQPVEFPIETRVGDLKDAIAADMHIPATHLVVRLGGRVASSDATLADCGLRPGRRVVEGNVVIDPTQTGGQYTMPSVLVVSVVDDDTGAVEREVIVRVTREGPADSDAPATATADTASAAAEADAPWAGGRKPYLGGFRDRRSGLEYHHAATQTGHARPSKWAGRAPRVSRDTQTPTVVARSAQTAREASTQMERRGLSIATARDRIVTAQPYVSSDAIVAIRTERAEAVQRCWRGYTARKRAEAMRRGREEEAEARDAAAAAAAAEAADRHRREVERRLNPRTAGDFASLFEEVEAWRQAETARIRETEMSEEERRESLARLLARQTTMLATVDGLRTRAIKTARQARVARTLESMAEPQRWETGDGAVAVVHTPFSRRAAELKALYEALTASPAELVASGAAEGLGAAEDEDEGKDGAEPSGAAAAAAAAGGRAAEARVRVLLQVKWTAKEFDCGLTRELVELIDREADLLARGRPDRSLRSLRRRLGNLFLQFVETPEFNPEAGRHQRVPRDLSSRPNVMPITRG